MHKEYQSILDKLENGKELSDKEFQILESYVHHHPQIQFPQVVTEKLKAEATNRANPEKLQEKVEKIKNSNGDLNKKADLIVKTYEDYLFYNNKEAFEEYWKKRKEMGEDWGKNNPIIQNRMNDIEKEFYKSLTSKINIKVVTQNMGKDVLDVKNLEDVKKGELIQRGRSIWKSPGDNGRIDNSIAIGNKIGDNGTFIDLVNSNKPLDLKSRVYREDYPFSIWGRQWEEGMESDYLGNYLFGYVGKGYLESSDEYLKIGAGAAQGLSDKDAIKYINNVINGNYGDNPGDAKMIQDGINDYKESYK